MPEVVVYLTIFVGLGTFFLFFHLMLGKLVRPIVPEADKLTIYECGEPTIGSAWIQFDLRFYVVALLFVIFDVEVAFFFPWAVVFGTANRLANDRLDEDTRVKLSKELIPAYPNPDGQRRTAEASRPVVSAAAAHKLAWIAFWDILVFFGVLLVGFAYLWRRGDLNWVRSIAAERTAAPAVPTRAAPAGAALVGAADNGW